MSIFSHNCLSLRGAGQSYQQIVKQNILTDDFNFTSQLSSNNTATATKTSLADSSTATHQLAAFLEITPSLAQAANVTYTGQEDNWYEAQHVFLVGYSQADRKKLIDAYMSEFQTQFNFYPTVSTAWMIDAWSLGYLRQHYGVLVHQITREQFGVDSYSLYGGPPHYPYYPSPSWALIPSQENPNLAAYKMPLIVRQTITDPVFNYGDPESCHTSQPNDFSLCNYPFSYFEQLFYQAHAQKGMSTSFALIGLENSMDETNQQLFIQQLNLVADWQQQSADNIVLTAQNYAKHYAQQANFWPKVYAGENLIDSMGDLNKNQAWWITTPYYRLRLRQDNETTYITDLRLYDSSFQDPYLDKKAKSMGWWIVPFLIDGSRYWQDTANDQLTAYYDMLDRRPDGYPIPTRLVIGQNKNPTNGWQGLINLSDLEIKRNQQGELILTNSTNQQPIAIFALDHFALPTKTDDYLSTPALNKILVDLSWQKNKQNYWGLTKNEQSVPSSSLTFYYPAISSLAKQSNLQEIFPQQLFPQLTQKKLDVAKSYLHKNNLYAIAGRNPVRLVLFPKDQYGQAVRLNKTPEIVSQPKLDKITTKRQHGHNGMIFIDFEHKQAIKTLVNIRADAFVENLNIYFAPDCKKQLLYCVSHPQKAWWYLRTKLGDWQRAREEKP